MTSTFANPMDTSDLTIDGLRKTMQELLAPLTPVERTLMGMTVKESPYLPEGVSMMTGHNSFALIYHETGKIVAFERDHELAPWKAKARL